MLDMIDERHVEWKDDVMSAVAERFERRLAESVSELRVSLIREIHDGRVELLKWTVVMWVGQMTVLLGLLFRGR
ncbi:MAG TPA: hypothetical protein VFA59_25480 [Vicinamibacterales bacterium]|nr:hypothetical protein [Vicinamibacterales bacterium]